MVPMKLEGSGQHCCIDPPTDEREMERNMDARVPCSRIDGWLELEFGEFLVAEGHNWDVEAKLSETEILRLKYGLIVEGIEEDCMYCLKLTRFGVCCAIEL
ncbi:UNVERIFIED_CONTAM: hypothetical protein Scaly_0794000 [Sesamum calycinum]|uniref:Uncharacterized protein n=1 Tax=Sesamum calycinum TaxID=2727403 RepID=A0AAW2R9T0_9LAMI